jgi:hypothetical protein
VFDLVGAIGQSAHDAVGAARAVDSRAAMLLDWAT